MVMFCTHMFNIQQLYAPLTLYVFCIYMRTIATCATYSIKWLAFITEMKSVYSAVRTGSLIRLSALCL